MAAARNAVRAATADLAPGDLVLVACSGGADSLALAAATAFVTRRSGVRAGAVIVDHGLQPGSGGVAADAARTCRGLGLDPVEVRRVVVGSDGGLEAAARAARYAALEDVARDRGAAGVLLGHTLDDQAETVLLGLARGSGARSLAGMRAVRGLWRRPFLGLRRSDTEAVCTANGLAYWQDPTNGAAGTPLRSQVRARALPALEGVLGPGVAEALARTADQLRDDADLLDGLADDLLERARREVDVAGTGGDQDGRGIVLGVEVLAGAPPALRRRALRSAAAAAGAPAGALGHTHVAALDALVTRWRGQGPLHLPGDLRAWRACGRLFLRPAPVVSGHTHQHHQE